MTTLTRRSLFLGTAIAIAATTTFGGAAQALQD